MKHIFPFCIAVTLFTSSIGMAQDNSMKGSLQCSMKKMSTAYPLDLGDSPNTPRHSWRPSPSTAPTRRCCFSRWGPCWR